MVYILAGVTAEREVMSERKLKPVTPAEMKALAVALGCRTQTALAEALGITQARVSQILSGKHPVKRGALLTLIRQLQSQNQDAAATRVAMQPSQRRRRQRAEK